MELISASLKRAPSFPRTVSPGSRISKTIFDAIETVPIGCRCTNTDPSLRATTACAGIPIYGSSSAGDPSVFRTLNLSDAGDPALTGPDESHSMVPAESSCAVFEFAAGPVNQESSGLPTAMGSSDVVPTTTVLV